MLRNRVAIVALFAFICFGNAQVPSIRATQATELVPLTVGSYVFPVDLGGDLMVFSLRTNTDPVISVQRRGSNGIYSEVTQINENAVPYTNGEWVAMTVFDPNQAEYYWNIYQMVGDTATNKVVIPAKSFRTVSFFPGNVLVGDENIADPNNYLHIYTYTDTWAFSSSVNIGDHVVKTSYYYTTSRDGKFIVTSNSSFADIWEFDSNGPTFNRIESLALGKGFKDMIIYNGVDTVVATNYQLASIGVAGAFQVYTKANGAWSTTQSSAAYDLGLRASANLGLTGTFIDESTFVLTAFNENSVALTNGNNSPSGVVIVMSRGVDGMWSYSLTIEADPQDFVSFGFNAALNSHKELIIPGVQLNTPATPAGYMYSVCIFAPADVTCKNVTELSNCNNFNVSTLYTINGNPACNDVNVTVVKTTVDDNLVVDFTFSKPGFSDQSCTSTVKCRVPVPQAPIAQPTPVAAPVYTRPPVNRPTSGATVINFVSALLFVTALAL